MLTVRSSATGTADRWRCNSQAVSDAATVSTMILNVLALSGPRHLASTAGSPGLSFIAVATVVAGIGALLVIAQSFLVQYRKTIGPPARPRRSPVPPRHRRAP